VASAPGSVPVLRLQEACNVRRDRALNGNYEAIASDWLFMPESTPAIHVAIRYALWVINAIDGADDPVRDGVEPSVE
jgi:hypothetical protein